MGEHKTKLQRFLADHPFCILCGGQKASEDEDHIPPRACFPRGYHPEDFSFPTCRECNSGSRDEDQVFGFYAQMADFNRENLDRAALGKALAGVYRFNPHMLPEEFKTARGLRSALADMGLMPPAGTAKADAPLLKIPKEFGAVVTVIGRKLACALAYRHLGAALTRDHRIATGWFQPQVPATSDLLDVLLRNAGGVVRGNRMNIKDYGERFGYRYHADEDARFILYAAQWGTGMIVWGIAAPVDLWLEWEAQNVSPTTELGDTHSIFGMPDDIVVSPPP